MKNVLTAIVLLVVIGGLAAASPVPCTSLTTLAAVIATNATGGCQNQDKIFTNWSYTIGSGSPNDAAALTDAAQIIAVSSFTTQSPGVDVHEWIYIHTGGWHVNFTLSYTISVDPGFPLIFINQSVDQFNLASNVSSNDLQIPDMGSPIVLNPSSSNLTVSSFIGPAKTITTNSVVTVNGSLGTYEQDWWEFTAPEPSSIIMILGGAGLIGMGLLRRRRQR